MSEGLLEPIGDAEESQASGRKNDSASNDETSQDLQALLVHSHALLFARLDLRIDTMQAAILEKLQERAENTASIQRCISARGQRSRRAAGSPGMDEEKSTAKEGYQAKLHTSKSSLDSVAECPKLKPGLCMIADSSSTSVVPPAVAPPALRPCVRRQETMGRRARRNSLQRFVSSGGFELFFGFAIITNTFFIGIQTDAAASSDGQQSTALEVTNVLYTFLFTAELVMKLCAERLDFFWRSPSWQWNWLDVVIVISSIVESSMYIFVAASSALSSGSSDTADPRMTQSPSQLRILRILRITRLIKVVRISRIIRFIRALRTMVHQLVSTLKSLMWAILLLGLVIYVFAIILTQSYTRYVEDQNFSGADPAAQAELAQSRALLQRFFGGMSSSMITLFWAVTGGINWEIVQSELSNLGWFPVSLFFFYICFTQFAVLNVLTGVFCQNAIDSASHDAELVAQGMLEQKQAYIDRLKSIFEEFDDDGSGTISITEFKERLSDEKVQAYFDGLQLDTSDIRMLFRLMDLDGGNELELDEFVAGCMRLKGDAKGVDMAKLSYIQDVLSKRLNHFIARTDWALSVLLDDSQDAVAARPGASQQLGALPLGAGLASAPGTGMAASESENLVVNPFLRGSQVQASLTSLEPDAGQDPQLSGSDFLVANCQQSFV